MRNKLPLSFLVVFLSACSTTMNRDGVWENAPNVETTAGWVGATSERDSWSWKGIPYAEAPTEDLRWRAPQDVSPWNGVREAYSYGEPCAQKYRAAALAGSEDCLVLNVWRPKSKSTQLPVFVWIHGGANRAGSSSTPGLSGANFAVRGQAIFVSMNYRLGPLGWFSHQALEDVDPDTNSGNFGTLDIIKTLEWVRDNIEHFGGNPNNVTVAGSSAGGINVLSLLISPRAEGLFHKAVSQSGLLAVMPVAEARASGNSMLADIMVSEEWASSPEEATELLESLPKNAIRSLLKTASISSVLAAFSSEGFGGLGNPSVIADGSVILADGYGSFRSGTYPNKVPLILGTNTGELRSFVPLPDAENGLDHETFNNIATIGGDLWKASGADGIAHEITDVAGQPDIFVYNFTWGKYKEGGSELVSADWNYKHGSGHTLEVPFFLDNIDVPSLVTMVVFDEENRLSRELLSKAMSGYLKNFIWFGDPNGEDSPTEWYAWSNAAGAPKYLVFDASKVDLQLRTEILGVSKQSAMDELYSISDPEIRKKVRDFLYGFSMSCFMLEEAPGRGCNGVE